jgi:hemin uptake protein HemP
MKFFFVKFCTLFSFVALIGTGSTAFVGTSPETALIAPKGKICFKIKNDTGSSQTLHTGSGTTPLNNLATNEICIEEGGKLYLADKGRKGKVLLEVTSKVANKTFKLSDLM